jgi:hypothetical protein
VISPTIVSLLGVVPLLAAPHSTGTPMRGEPGSVVPLLQSNSWEVVMQYAMLIAVLAWAVLAVAVAGLALYRKFVSSGELDVVHIRDSEAALIPRQESLAHRLDSIDHWGKLLTVATVAYGFLIAVVFLVRVWQAGLAT